MGHSPSEMDGSSGDLLQVLPENLLLGGLLSTRYSSCQESAPARVLHRLQIPSGHIHLLQREVLHRLQNGYMLYHGLLHGLQWNLCPGTWSTSSSFLTDLGVCTVISLT